MLGLASQDLDIAQALNLGANDYICKPFSGTELLVRIEAAVKQRRMHHKALELHMQRLHEKNLVLVDGLSHELSRIRMLLQPAAPPFPEAALDVKRRSLMLRMGHVETHISLHKYVNAVYLRFVLSGIDSIKLAKKASFIVQDVASRSGNVHVLVNTGHQGLVVAKHQCIDSVPPPPRDRTRQPHPPAVSTLVPLFHTPPLDRTRQPPAPPGYPRWSL